jgi:site-specific recombinase XerD
MTVAALPALLQGFFTDRLTTQMQASPHTIAGYRDTFRLFLRFASERRGRSPTQLKLEELDADLVADFLVHIETKRSNGARSRNTRLAAIRSFFRYVALTEPGHLPHCQRILAMPSKRYVKRTVDFLNRNEMAALVAAPDSTSWIGRRDRALLAMTLQTGLRASEVIRLRREDVVFGTGAHVCCLGKGRKQRSVPLRRDTARVLELWLKERGGGGDDDVLFPSIRGDRLSRDALAYLVRRHTLSAAALCPSLVNKRVTPHTLRHSTAMQLLQHGVDQSVIALWLGHESVETTQIYLHADQQLKERALSRMATPEVKSGRFRPDDSLLAFLEAL